MLDECKPDEHDHPCPVCGLIMGKSGGSYAEFPIYACPCLPIGYVYLTYYCPMIEITFSITSMDDDA